MEHKFDEINYIDVNPEDINMLYHSYDRISMTKINHFVHAMYYLGSICVKEKYMRIEYNGKITKCMDVFY